MIASIPGPQLVRIKAIADNINDPVASIRSGNTIALQDVEAHTGRLLPTYRDRQVTSGVKAAKPGDVLFGKLRPYLAKAIVVSEPSAAVSEFLVLRPRAALSPSYLGYVLRSAPVIDHFTSLGYGAKMPRVEWTQVGSTTVPFADADTQESIVRYLDHAELRFRRAITGKRLLLRLLDEARDALIWETIFAGPGDAEKSDGPSWMAGRPSSWTQTRIKALLDETDVRSRTGEEPLLSLRMREGLVRSSDYSDRPEDPKALVGYKMVGPGTLVMNRMRASIGLFGIARESGIVSPDYATFVPRSSAEIHMPFLLRLLQSRRMGALIRSESRGLGTGTSGFLRIYSDRFGALPIAMPSKDEQENRATMAEERSGRLQAAASAVATELRLLDEFRASMIWNVISGHRDVRAQAALLNDVDPRELAGSIEVMTDQEDDLEADDAK